jgi:hypothetical protein
MLTGRSVLITAIIIAAISLVATVISLLGPPDRNGLGADTYGTRAQGYRAAFDTFDELGFDVRRGLAPPTESVELGTTLVLWDLDQALVEAEPVYLEKLRQWIRNGGRLIVAPPSQREIDGGQSSAQRRFSRPINVLTMLGLPIETKMFELSPPSGDENRRSRDGSASQNRGRDDFRSDLENYFFPTLFPVTEANVAAKGGLAEQAKNVATLALPCQVQVLDLDLTKPDGQISLVLPPTEADSSAELVSTKKAPILVAQIKLGAGEVIVVSDPAVFDNRLFPQVDNSVLAVDLLAAPRQTIVWDEFYHGLTVRSNPLFLLTRSFYGLAAAMIFLVTAVWIWREAIFLGPPLSDPQVKRRTIAEYVTATANFFHRGSASLEFMLQELRRGVLWSLRSKYGSRGDKETPEAVATAVARHDPQAGRKLLDSVREADLLLSQPTRPKERNYFQAAKDLIDCL